MQNNRRAQGVEASERVRVRLSKVLHERQHTQLPLEWPFRDTSTDRVHALANQHSDQDQVSDWQLCVTYMQVIHSGIHTCTYRVIKYVCQGQRLKGQIQQEHEPPLAHPAVRVYIGVLDAISWHFAAFMCSQFQPGDTCINSWGSQEDLMTESPKLPLVVTSPLQKQTRAWADMGLSSNLPGKHLP